MKINEKFINDIFNYKIKLKKDADKKKLSLFTDLIPMYDIYTQKIYPIQKDNIFYRLTESHYRFINNEVKNWIEQLYEKYSKKLKKESGDDKKQLSDLVERIKNMILIIDNYDVDTLIDTSYKVLYKYSGIGLTISICKRNSFHPFIFYLKPYYTKTELVKLGQNMGLLNNIKPEDLIDEIKHYEICKFISNNDVSFDEIKKHTLTIIDNKTIPDICFYSFIGATLLNRFLRNQEDYSIDTFFYNRLKNIVSTINKAPKLEKDYQIYRFVANNDFVKDLKIGDYFIDSAFLSTTRDPFYSPGLNGTFGLILIKINLKEKSCGLFMEHLSLFQKEEEFLLPPNTKLKLISKDNNFKYFHTNTNFEKIIHEKYEFDLISNDYTWFESIKPLDIDIPVFENIDSNVKNKLDLFQKFKNLSNKYGQIYINNLCFTLSFFDSTGSYSKFYYNKINKGLSLIYYDNNGYPLISIEMGTELVVNFINQYYFYNEKKDLDEKKLLELITKIGIIFNYKKAIIFNNYKNFSQFNKNYFESQQIFLYLNHYDDTLYNYLKNNIKPFSFEPFYQNNFKDIDLLLNKKDLKNKLIEIIEKDFNQYKQYEMELNKFNFGILNIYDKLIAEGKIDIMLELEYSDEYKKDDNLDLIYRTPIRRSQ